MPLTEAYYMLYYAELSAKVEEFFCGLEFMLIPRKTSWFSKKNDSDVTCKWKWDIFHEFSRFKNLNKELYGSNIFEIILKIMFSNFNIPSKDLMTS